MLVLYSSSSATQKKMNASSAPLSELPVYVVGTCADGGLRLADQASEGTYYCLKDSLFQCQLPMEKYRRPHKN
jgi:hypothetical protein